MRKDGTRPVEHKTLLSHDTATAPDGLRMPINVEILGGSLSVQHCIEEIGESDHLRLVSDSDVFVDA
jgi:hypothetical protein